MMQDTGLVGVTLAVGTRLERLAAIASELDDRDLADEAVAERRRLLEARFFAACVGQFKRGKSTLINALVGEAVLPVGVIPVTSVVTILSYGDAPGATVRLASGQSHTIALESMITIISATLSFFNGSNAFQIERANGRSPPSLRRDAGVIS